MTKQSVQVFLVLPNLLSSASYIQKSPPKNRGVRIWNIEHQFRSWTKCSRNCKIIWFTIDVRHYKQTGPPPPQKKRKRRRENSSLSLFYTAKTHLRPWQCCKSITKINNFNRKVNENNQSNHLFIYCFHKSEKKKKRKKEGILISESLNQTQI